MMLTVAHKKVISKFEVNHFDSFCRALNFTSVLTWDKCIQNTEL